MRGLRIGMLLTAAALAGCQSTAQSTTEVSTAPAQDDQAAVEAAYVAPAAPAAAAQCAIQIAEGPPPKPNKGADFGAAAAKNIGKNVGRNLISGIAGAVAGPLGGAVAAGASAHYIRSEQDLKGVWTATDGSPNCGCSLEISAATNLQLKTANAGRLRPKDCSNALLAQAARWTLGHSFTGYDAPFALIAADGRQVASLKRDGVDYFSGTLADGTPVTIWRK